MGRVILIGAQPPQEGMGVTTAIKSTDQIFVNLGLMGWRKGMVPILGPLPSESTNGQIKSSELTGQSDQGNNKWQESMGLFC